MKPRQTLKNYHNSNVPPYQQNLPSAMASSSSASSSTTSALRDIDLAKLGLTLDDMPNLQANSNLTNQDDLVKCLQAIYGKSSADILQKLPPLNDWPMQSTSSPDFQRIGGGPVLSSGGSGGTNNCANVNARGSSGLSFNNNNIVNVTGNNYNSRSNSGQQKQLDIQQQLANSHQQTASNVNQFRSPNLQQTPQLQQQQLSQHKSILSLHQQHQNDLNNRRLNHLNTTSAPFANLNTANLATTTANNPTNIIASSSGTTLDTNNLNSFNSMISKAGTVAGVSNIMDSLGSNDNMFYDGSINTTKDTSNSQQTLIKHQQLQRLLKATGSQIRPSSSTPPTITTSMTNVSSHRSDMMPQRNLNSNNMTPTQNPVSSQISAISPPHTALSSVPKSLLNLAACSSTSPTSTNSSSLPTHSYFSSMVNQLNLKSGRNNEQTNLNSKSTVKSVNYHDNLGDAFSQRLSGNLVSQNSLLQHSTRSTVPEANNNPNSSTGSNRSSSKQLQWSLLSEDQSSRQLNPRTVSITNLNSSSSTPKTMPTSNNHKVAPGTSSKEAYLADLQERAARAGVSIGEINKPIPPTNITNNDSTSSGASQRSSIVISPNQPKDETPANNLVGRKEIESALSRVEARNDLSLLYPPMLLAANSQKQINALSAGLQDSEDTELFTKEVKKIILEECNIIYECKECNNLFRSLANLVKHKRTYCLESSSDRMGIDMNKRSYTNATTPVDQSVTTIPLNEEVQLYCDVNSEPKVGELAYQNNGLRSIERRNNLTNDLRMLRMMRDHQQEKQKSCQAQDVSRLEGQKTSLSSHASLSKILQSQPKNRLPVSKDNASMGKLNLPPTSSNFQSKSAHNGTKNIKCSTSDMGEQLSRNSTLAKTILNEKVKNNPTQSLIELSKVFSNETDQPRSVKRPAPKRNLEDCIQKVKRDKLLTEDEQSLLASNATIIRGSSLQASQSRAANHHQVDMDMGNNTSAPKFNSPDADYDSDKLEIDLDDPGHRSSFKRAKRRISTPPSSSTASSTSTSSSTRLNSSSALLKALTRPVDTRRSINNASIPCDKESGDQVSTIEQDKDSKSSSLDVEKSSTERDMTLSPLFETYACDICGRVYVDLMSLMDHTIEQHPKEKMVYPCIFCSLSFIALENVCRHIVDIHKKPKGQVQRLKEVVRSRSYISSDFLACCDYPSSAVDLKDTVSEVDDKPIDEAIQELVEAEAAFENIMKLEEWEASEQKSTECKKDEQLSKDGDSSSKESSSEDSSGEESSGGDDSSSEESSSESSSSEDSSEEESSSEEVTNSNSSKKPSPMKDPNLPFLSDNSDSEASLDGGDSPEFESSPIQPTEGTVESEELECESSPIEQTEPAAENDGLESESSLIQQATETNASLNESSKQIALKPSSSIKSSIETTPSSSNASGSGGIMKLKIQLKTTPDEKSKVYEIAR